MIEKIKISNFKSVQELELELGRLNVFIGENGSGKTSILEGIAMGSAAASDKLENEFLTSRGIRVTDATLMKSAFNKDNDQPILVEFLDQNENKININTVPPLFPVNKWETTVKLAGLHVISTLLNLDKKQALELLAERVVSNTLKNNLFNSNELDSNQEKIESIVKNIIDEEIRKAFDGEKRTDVLMADFLEEKSLNTFLLFAPENYFLRRFEEEGQIRPLGIRGEGLFRHLVELSKEEPQTFKAIAEELKLIDWYEGFSIPNDLNFSERRISITDRFISDTIKEFDQRSANEGFLYLLFYFTLFLSKYTPKFFAIDNIDNALNPRLCTKLLETLARLTKEQDKQAILTTHNPAVLDGLDLHDDEQRLFVIYRNDDGETKARRIMPLKETEGKQKVRLSEAFVRGYLGGLPSNF